MSQEQKDKVNVSIKDFEAVVKSNLEAHQKGLDRVYQAVQQRLDETIHRATSDNDYLKQDLPICSMRLCKPVVLLIQFVKKQLGLLMHKLFHRVED
jgi:hypothetical protein